MGYSHLGCYGGEIQTPNFDALVHEPGQLPDIMATCLEAAGASYPREFGGRAITPLEGRSLLPAFAGRSIERDGLFWEHEGNRTVRVGQWKLVAKGPGGPWELHDLAADRTEMNDLGGQQPERVKQPAAQWDAWAKRAHVLSWPWQTKTRNPNVESRNKSE
jgi:arylsulfatase